MELKKLFTDTTVARYNVTAWEKADRDDIVLIGREVEKPGTMGEPDIGRLVLLEMDSDHNITHERVIWDPQGAHFYLEDPRALLLPSNTILIGLTVVMRSKDGFEPFPALAKIDNYEEWSEELPPITLIQTFGTGKNLTPLDKDTFLFRPNSDEYFHKLMVFTFRKSLPRKIQDIEFPDDLPWGKWRIGTTMSPLWINPDEALLIIHGINFENGKYIYNLGRAKLFRDGDKYEIVVDPQPILTPDSFKDEKGQPLVEELHPNLRRVVYSVGGIVKRKRQDTLFLYVNVGDRATYEVGFILEELTSNLAK